MVGGCDRNIIGEAVVVGVIVVVERRHRQQHLRVEGMNPGGIEQGVGLVLAVAKADAGELRSEVVPGDRSILDVIGVGIVGNLIVVAAPEKSPSGAGWKDRR